jgi:superfamily I DNA/RNA helicase
MCADALARRGSPHQVRKKAGQFDPGHESIKLMTMHVSKGLEFPVVAMVGVGHMPAEGEDECEEARLFHVGGLRGRRSG